MKAKNEELFVKIASKQAIVGIFNNIKSLNSNSTEKNENEKNKLFNYKIKSLEPSLTINTNNFLSESDRIYQDLPCEKLACYSNLNSDIILKGHLINLGINSKGLIGSNISFCNKYTGLYNNEKKYDYFNCKTNNFIKISYQHLQNGIINVYNSNKSLENIKNFTSISHIDKCMYDILSTQTIIQSTDLEQNITYSYRKFEKKISISIALTNISEQTIRNIRYNYMINTNFKNLLIHPDKPAFINYDENLEGLYLRTNNTRAYIVMNLDDTIIKYDPNVNSNIIGLAFEKAEINPNNTYLINFCLGFASIDDFNTQHFFLEQTGLKLSFINFRFKNMSSVSTICADFTDCDISGADLSDNILIGAKTGPLLECSNPPSVLPYGYDFITTKSNEKFIIGPGVNNINSI